MIQLLTKFIKAERTGNWELHLQSVWNMLPYFAAAGHSLYAKSAYVYITSMQNLEDTHPEVFHQFKAGHHVFRRSGRYWAGLSTDLMIEYVLMRSVKSSGGLTRVRGMGETQRAEWLLSMPACADINNAMQDLTGVGFHTSDQHKEVAHARKERDKKGITSILSFLTDMNPFLDDPSLRNIDTGTPADSRVNADRAKEIATNIIQSMSGQNILNFTFKISQQVITLRTKTSIKIDGEQIQVDPQPHNKCKYIFLKIHQPSLNMNSVVFHLLFLIQAVFLGKYTSLLWQMQSGALGTVVLRKRMTVSIMCWMVVPFCRGYPGLRVTYSQPHV